jgi:hypothetical protein
MRGVATANGENPTSMGLLKNLLPSSGSQTRFGFGQGD